ncbi:hypothetical protein AMTRI_Chr02g216210 [Amborella trichopoda]|uniref:Late embryogenesis abundant protein LEA-2 subgroup domain-containing protein n=1 Tax=Amborella trichopoda TaxID=13333 RepID=U5DA79_AMBTC|nr:protein NDR1 [Amborella trichopoda]ERN17298.1 hypothetical protein AMTR_s00037p00035600 [Amborella trichopoda]|eukprot:XP_006855831.1 protein NDR1 [Amborella trichopoda]
MSECRGFYSWCFGFTFLLGLTTLFLWLSLRPQNPSYDLIDFYSPALDIASNSPNTTRNTTILFQLKISNPNKDSGIHYDAINVSLYYKEKKIGESNVQGFYQGHKKTAKKSVVIAAANELFWEAASLEVLNRTAVFRVDLVIGLRFKVVWANTRHKGVEVAGHVPVGVDGKMVAGKKKRIKLK